MHLLIFTNYTRIRILVLLSVQPLKATSRHLLKNSSVSGVLRCKNSFIKCQYRFWHQYEQTSNPNDKIAKALLKVVRRHLTPPPSSTNVERLFSYGGLVATDHRASLSGEKLDQILFLRENALMANFNLGWL